MLTQLLNNQTDYLIFFKTYILGFFSFFLIYFSFFLIKGLSNIIIFGKTSLAFFPVYLFIVFAILKKYQAPPLPKDFLSKGLNFLLWRIYFFPPPKKDKDKKKEVKVKDDNIDKFVKWVAYAYILGFGAICFYLILTSNACTEVDDSEYNDDYILRTGDSRFDYLFEDIQYYQWEWDSEFQTYVQVEDNSEEYDSDLDPEGSYYKPYRANTEEEEVSSLLDDEEIK